MIEKMGYAKDDRLLIVNADDFGMSHSTNKAVMELLKDGFISSASLMVPCPWAKQGAEFCRDNPDVSVGVHLTFTSEWGSYKWGPVTQGKPVDSLVDEHGYMHRSSTDVEKFAKPEQVREEIRNQITKAMDMGLDPSHIDNHMGSLYGLKMGNSFLEIIFDFCVEYQLPFRIPRKVHPELMERITPEILKAFNSCTALAEARGIVVLDYLIGLPTGQKTDYEVCRDQIINVIKNLKPGVTELYIHPAIDCEELRDIAGSWKRRDQEYKVFKDEEVIKTIQDEGIKIITWKDLRDYQRSNRG